MPLKVPQQSAGDHPGAVRTALFAGVFDPITLGHLELVQRAAAIFGRLIVGVGTNPDKSSLFTLAERVELVAASVRGLAGVTVESFQGLTVRFARERGASVIVRGVRSAADVDYELTMARTNRVLEPSIETVFLPAAESYSHISSTLIRQLAGAVGSAELAKFVPEPVIEPL